MYIDDLKPGKREHSFNNYMKESDTTFENERINTDINNVIGIYEYNKETGKYDYTYNN